MPLLRKTIRDACVEQHTLLPDWIDLGSGSSGYQFSYYGFLRPDILIGCLFPQIPMVYILIGYMLALYLASVLLCYMWLQSEDISPFFSFIGSVLFLTAGCLFHMHRQIMFVNYLPFLILAFLCVKKRKFRFLPLCMLLICLHSFYFAIAAFAAIGWYWLRTEKRHFGKIRFSKIYPFRRSFRMHGGGAPSADRTCTDGAQTKRRRIFSFENIRAFRTEYLYERHLV